MNKIKKIILVCALSTLFIYLFFLYGNISPLENVLGCYEARYKSFSERVCFYESKKYEQFYILDNGEIKKHNNSTFRSFTYSNDEGNFTAVVLNSYIITDNNGFKLPARKLTVRPYNNSLGKGVFTLQKSIAGSYRIYKKINVTK